MECFDISNLQGTEVVASMVVFEDGLPRKSEYRRFVIRGVDGQNDVAAMHEVITRRFRRLLDDRTEAVVAVTAAHRGDGAEDGPLLIDPTTGAPRASRTRRRWSSWTAARRRSRPRPGRWTSWASTTSRSAVWPSGWRRCGCPTCDEPVILPRTSEGLYLLQRLRDEAHRFAITHHRVPAEQVDGRVRARLRCPASARSGARRCSRTSAR